MKTLVELAAQQIIRILSEVETDIINGEQCCAEWRRQRIEDAQEWAVAIRENAKK